ncbi:Glycosyltransferase involved in cell wall bisynthesis [Pseudarcicella hirudinis]|uniref:Glycosyltransferase involved in cell wall bisynthesis n=1 Tax=Pseudarcicella hirudinis TaxID=1079859 RepID=A0A1I5Y6Z5_9BACT|nr:glycosyltransferase family 2 protein [Pseudarcicella hirudinis]SFQ39943.1 Glycosyltransferase involved in cell wall bisynthesis [Pseudarcicella hirudinis]
MNYSQIADISPQKFVSKPLFDINQPIEKDLKYPKISVITPSYNQADYLERTILSVLNQNYPNLEYIIMDGGSTDRSVEVIKKYEKHLTSWVSQKDNGQAAAINEGFRKATGDLICFQNSDDVFTEGAFQAVLKAYRANTKAGVFYGNLMLIDENDIAYEVLKVMPFSMNSLVFEGMQCHNQAFFFKKELLEKYGYLNENFRFAFDYEIMSRFGIEKSVEKVLVDDLWGAFRIHSDSKTSNISQVGLKEHAQIKAEYAKKLKSPFSERMIYYFCRIRKLLYFILKGDFAYLKYRKSL